MDVSSKVLNELAQREAALDAQIQAAREEAKQVVAAAEAQAAGIMRDAEALAKQMSAEHEQKLSAEVGQIRDAAGADARTQAQSTRDRAEGKLGHAVETIMRAVLP
ncbi:V-type ATPase subunit subunit G family protein [Deinococcus frigens]|uniref:V-type ATPase subunit subunit G family protein n=1 Tax=Deinococcus frigens TaxID=249403 RepID=UPI000497A255|nr:V-type ATPase subunit subunit G family protein [Deinococcus frigens]